MRIARLLSLHLSLLLMLGVLPATAQRPRPAGVWGAVLSVDAAAHSFVVARSAGLTVTVLTDANTRFRKNDTTPAAFPDVTAGAEVEAAGVINPDGSITARRVLIVVQERVEVAGTVAGVDSGAASFVVHPRRGFDITVRMDASTGFRKNDGSPATFADVAAGVEVTVRGIKNEDASVSARNVVLVLVRPVQFGGAVVSVDPAASRLVVQRRDGPSVLVRTDANTEFRKNDGGTAAFADLAAGQEVEIAGNLNQDGSVAARRVVLLVVRYVNTGGTVLNVSATGFVLHPRIGQDVAVFVDGNTEFREADGDDATFANVMVGARVTVRGTQNADGTLTARNVVIVSAGRR
jgi:uncharacterized protein DUF5666